MKKSAVTILCMSIAIVMSCSTADVQEYAVISFMIGGVTKNKMPVEIGEIVKEKDEIKTAEDSFCDIKIGSSIIRIKEKSDVIVSSLLRKGNLENTQLGLDRGRMLCKPKKLLKSESFIVKTPTAVAGVRGTKFIVEADSIKTTRIKVFDGKVKIAKRVKQFEGSIDKVLEVAPVISKEEKVVITQKEVDKAEKIVEKIMKKETAGAKEVAISTVIQKTKETVAVSKNDIEKFRVQDFVKEQKEMIEVKEKPKKVIRKIARVLKKDRETPKPQGRLLITRYEVYYIKNGRVMWEGQVITPPAKQDDRLYIASGKYVFCASSDGQIIWKTLIENDGKFEIRENRLVVFVKGEEKYFNLETGKDTVDQL